MRKALQIFAECPLTVIVDSFIVQRPLVSSIAMGRLILKLEKSSLILKLSPVSERKGSLPKDTESQVELDFRPFPLGWQDVSAEVSC